MIPAIVLPVRTKYRPIPAQTSASKGPATNPIKAMTIWRCDTGAVFVDLVKGALPSFETVLHRGFRRMPAFGRILIGQFPGGIEFRRIRIAINMDIE